MRYKRQQQTKQTDIEMTPLKEAIEEIFCPNNIHADCDTIGSKMWKTKIKNMKSECSEDYGAALLHHLSLILYT